MKSENSLKAVIVILMMFGATSVQADKGSGKSRSTNQVSQAGNGATAQDTRVRLRGKIEAPELDLASGQEIHAKFESRDTRRRLSAEAEGFTAGMKFTVSIKVGAVDHLLGDITVGVDTTGEINFDESNWVVGLPMDIPVGSMVTFKSANDMFQVSLQPK